MVVALRRRLANSALHPTSQGRIACADSNGATEPNCPVVTP
jgi:hypothetical protein